MKSDAFIRCRAALIQILARQELDAHDEAVWAELCATANSQNSYVTSIALERKQTLSLAVWATIIRVQLHYWEEGGRTSAGWLIPYFEILSSDGQTATESPVGRICRVVSLIGEAELQLNNQPSLPVNIRRPLIEGLTSAADVTVRDHPGDTFYICYLALFLFEGLRLSDHQEFAAILTRLAEVADEIAKVDHKPEQFAVAAQFHAFKALIKAERDKTQRLNAYDACEIAIERLHALQEDEERTILAHLLVQQIHQIQAKEWGYSLVPRLVSELPEYPRRAEIMKFFNVSKCLPRVMNCSMEDSHGHLEARLNQQKIELMAEDERLNLEPPPHNNIAAFNSLDWTVAHPAYRRAVPYGKSFIQERDFPFHLLTLLHELTHVYSLYGPVGYSLVALQTGIIRDELMLAGRTGRKGDDTEYIAPGLVRIEPNDAFSLCIVDHQLNLILKMRILIEVWTPWFEGLAVFAETALDPERNPNGICDVLLCLRNLVDLHFGSDSGREEIIQKSDQFAREFDALCVKALRSKANFRMRDNFGAGDPAYFAGYLSVRAVVAAWRKNIDQAETSTRLFDLLMHATRYGSFEAIPDLLLPNDRFKEEAQSRMGNWVQSLKNLGRDHITQFIKSDNPRHYRWLDGGIVEVNPEEFEHFNDLGRASAVRLLDAVFGPQEHALGSNRTAQPTSQDFEPMSALQAWYDQICVEDKVDNTWIDFFNLRTHLNSLLPIGRSMSKFSLEVGGQDTASWLWVNIRTTEKHVDTDSTSTNLIMYTLPFESAMQIADIYNASGAPRMRVTRLINVSNVLLQPSAYRCAHYIAIEYNGWSEIIGTVGPADSDLNKDDNHGEWVKRLIQRRLNPVTAGNINHDVVSQGLEPAKRTLSWLEESNRWAENGEPLNGVGSWAEALKSVSRRICSAEEAQELRKELRKEAINALLAALYPTTPQVTQIIRAGLWHLTETRKSDRDHIIDALISTGLAPCESAWLEANNSRLRSCGIYLFDQTQLGWDVISDPS